MPPKNSKVTSPSQKAAQNAPRSASISAGNAPGSSAGGGHNPHSSATARRNSEIAATSNVASFQSSNTFSDSLAATNQRASTVESYLTASPSSSSTALPASTAGYHPNRMKNNHKGSPLLSRPLTTTQFTPAALTGLTNLGSEEKFAYMVNNEEFPALNDSIATPPVTHSDRIQPNPLLNTENAPGDCDPPRCGDNLYDTNSTIGGGFSKGTFGAADSNRNIDANRYYALPSSELPITNSVSLNSATSLSTQKGSTENDTTSKEKDPEKFIKILRKKKNVNGSNSLVKVFPLIDQVKMSYPFSKFSVGASVDLPHNFYHYIHNDQENSSQYIAPLIESCPITALYRVTKHLDDYFVPLDYLTLAKFHEKSPFCCDKYSDEILLFLYYSHVRDGLQMLAAYHLHKRGWRFHLVKKHWITLTNDQYKSYTALINSKNSSTSFVKDTFWFFNVYKWCMEKVETTLDFRQFESAEVYAQYLCEGSNSTRNGHVAASSANGAINQFSNDNSQNKCNDGSLQYAN